MVITVSTYQREKPLYTILIVSYMMKRLLICILILASVSAVPVQGANISQRAVYLQERVVVVRFINMGVDAYWGEHILENAATALPILEELIGVPLPPQIESVEIYGKRDLGLEEWVLGYNDTVADLVALKTDHPNPTIVFHELVHFWTNHYNIPWPLAEGYCNLYADLCALRLGLYEVAYPDMDWEQQYVNLQNHDGNVPLNNMNYMDPERPEVEVDYFYLASTVMMYNFYETVGEENLKAINEKVAQSSLDGRRGGVGIIQYLRVTKEVTGVNYAHLFMPVVFAEWEDGEVNSFEEGVGRYCAVSALTGAPDSDEQMGVALTALVNGKFAEFETAEQDIVNNFYAQQMVEEKELPEQEIIYPEKKTGLLSNRLFLAGIVVLVVVVILLIYALSKIAKEEEEFEWEQAPLEGPAFWSPPPQRPTEEIAEELPEIPDLGELTK